MKKGITLAMCLAFVACGMLAAGCTQEHVHNWSSDWTTDSTGHWQTCDGCDEKNESAAHSGGTATCTEKAECEVCGEAYGELAAHSYTVLKSDADSHWYECLCGAKDETSDEAHSGGTANCQQGALCEDCGVEYTAVGTHAYTIPSGNDTQHWLECVCGEKDTNTVGDHTGGTATCTNKAECDECGMPYGALAAHEYTVAGKDAAQHWMECACGAKDESTVVNHSYTVAGSDETKHWNACECGAKDPATEGAHTAANVIGQCDTCGYQINDFSIEDILEMIEDNASKVKMGTTSYVSGTEGNWNPYNETATYEYRNGYLYIENVKNGYYGPTIYEDYYMLKADGSAFSIRVTDGTPAFNPDEYTVDHVRGFRFNPGIINDIMSFYGAEELIVNLYDEAQYNENDDLAVYFKLEGGKIVAGYSFGYYPVADGYFYSLTVDFTLSADGWLESVDVYSYKYLSDEFKVEDGNAIPTAEKAFYNYHITVTQSNECENADVANPYDPAVILIQSFELVSEGGETLGDVLEVEAATSQQKFYLQNVTPSTAIAELNPVTFEIDGEEIGFFDTRLMVNYAKSSGYIGIRPNQLVGEYPLTIKVGGVSKTVLVKVLAATPTSLTANVFDGVVYNKTTTASTYEGMNVRFNAVANVAYADAGFTAAISSSNAADATLTWDSEAGEYVFNSAVVGEYVITLTSTKAPSVTSTLTVSVNELPDVASILSGEYEYAMNPGTETFVVYTAAFTPDATAEGISGTVDVTWTNQGTVVYAYTYDAENGLQLTKTGGADLALTVVLNNEFALLVERAGSQYALTKKTAGGEEGGEEDDKSPMYSYAVILSGVHSQGFNLGGTLYQNAIVTFNPGEMTDTKLTGMLTVKDPNARNAEYEFSYEYTVDGGFVATSATDFSSATYSYAVTLDSNLAIVVTKTRNGGSATPFTCTQESSDPDAYTVGGGSSEGGEEGGEGEEESNVISVTTTDTYSWVDEYTFTATAAGKYTFTVPAGLGVWGVDSNEPEIDYNLAPDGGSFSVELAAGAEFVYLVSATTKADWEITWTYEEVSEEPAETSGTISVTTTDTYGYNDEYTFTAPAAGTYSFYVPAGLGFYSKDAKDVYAPAELDYMENADGGYVEVTLAAGEAYVFYIAATTKDDWTITWSIKAEEEGGDVTPSSKQLVLGENTVNVTADDITAQAIEGYTFVVTEEGTYTFASNSLMIRVYVTETNFSNGTAYLTAGTYKVVIITAYTSQTGNHQINVEYTAPVVENTLVLGENNIVVSEDDITAGGINYTFEVTEEGTYSFASNALMAVINFADGSTQRGQAYLTAGTYTIGIVTAYISGAGTYTMTVTYEAPVVESEPDGSESNPYVWDTFPVENFVVSESNADAWTFYSFTVTEANTYVFTFDITDTWYIIYNSEGTGEYSGMNKQSFEADLAAGTYKIGLGNGTTTAPLTVTVTVKEVTGGGNEGEGGEATGAVTYLSEKHGSGRYLQVEIDRAAGTMTLTRSDMTGNFGTGGVAVSEYTISGSGADTTATFVSGTNCTIVWNDDGTPKTITWGSAAFTGFTVQ